ncbi:hypothetical protein HYPSUDRAFT_46747 [Hypholoma sublateritium FD-334 SS-4]|uniref:C2H2-type domain-containing protein n=1 Tax=Hypholoma sublateritium (strain FD-334 SS-4) TaxID=945553 RepID=A0A0D2M1U3_HYPSF|nr:hypothetical protein HYPSUDRAFT_46747 [Hypholoma sublateritium FD-334 SS-4]
MSTESKTSPEFGSDANGYPPPVIVLEEYIPQDSTEAVPNRFKCSVGTCSHNFSSKQRLASHVNRFHPPHGQQIRHFCSQCGYSTTYKSDLARHRNSIHVAKSSSSVQGGT